jgi:phenylpropionate dioxygenase-like ring-hydroxylating dioxygenase large terminal subunit
VQSGGKLIEHRLWHPVCAESALSAAEPLAARLLGHDLVLWRSAPGVVHAWADRCPHRGSKLSLGRVIEGPDGARLACPYHGWQFGATAQCLKVPALPEFTPPATHRACAHPAQLAHGLVWVQLEASDLPLPEFNAGSDPLLRKLLCGPYEVQTSAPRVVENFLDLAHFGFVHAGWLGDAAHAQVSDYQIDATPQGFVASGCRAWQPRSNALSEQGSEVAYRYEVLAPFTAELSKLPQAQSGDRDVIALFVCPCDEERVQVWFLLAVTDHASSDAALREFQEQIFRQDQPVLESQSPKRLPVSSGVLTELHCAADRSSAAYRRMLRERGITFGVC